jgi:hypothetical protein
MGLPATLNGAPNLNRIENKANFGFEPEKPFYQLYFNEIAHPT